MGNKMIRMIFNMIFGKSFLQMNHKDKWIHYHMKQTTKEVTDETKFTERK